ncbi:MAG: HEAT repeat domain-containing protein, partial [Longimicrobiales bacterium]
MTESDRPAAVVREALLAAWRLPHGAVTLANIVRWTTHADPETRWRAAYALARGSSAGAVPALLHIIDDADYRVRSYAVRGMRAGRADSAGVRERALTALLAAARDSHPHVRINALQLLAAYRSNDRTTPFLAEALADPDANVAIAAAQGLGQARDPAASSALRLVTAPGRPDGVRTTALHSWMRADSASAVVTALQWADSSRWLLRMHAARALAAAPSSEAAPALHELARDPHYLVAAEALGSVRSIGDSIPAGRHLFIELLAASHPLVRAAAIRGLAAHVGAADMDLLLQAYDRARQDSVRDAAAAAVVALARIRRTGMPVERSFFLRFGSQGAPRD